MGSLLSSKEPQRYQRKSIFERSYITDLLTSSRIFRQRMDRQLSPHVTSRWYRSPEVILKDKIYSFKSDIWSIGCIFGECISFTNTYRRNGGRDHAKRVMFPGTSCFPISPRRHNNCSSSEGSGSDSPPINDGDQLIKII